MHGRTKAAGLAVLVLAAFALMPARAALAVGTKPSSAGVSGDIGYNPDLCHNSPENPCMQPVDSGTTIHLTGIVSFDGNDQGPFPQITGTATLYVNGVAYSTQALAPNGNPPVATTQWAYTLPDSDQLAMIYVFSITYSGDDTYAENDRSALWDVSYRNTHHHVAPTTTSSEVPEPEPQTTGSEPATAAVATTTTSTTDAVTTTSMASSSSTVTTPSTAVAAPVAVHGSSGGGGDAWAVAGGVGAAIALVAGTLWWRRRRSRVAPEID